MASYSELKRRIKGGSQSWDDDDTSKEAPARGSRESEARLSKYERLKQAVKSGGVEYDLTSDEIEGFFNDSKAFMASAGDRYNKTADKYSDWRGGFEDFKSKSGEYRSRADYIKSYLNANKDRLEPEAYAGMSDYIDKYLGSQDDLSKRYYDLERRYRPFKTEDDYLRALAGERAERERQEAAYAERERLSSLNLDTIDRQIDALEGQLSRAAEEEQAASDAYARLASGVGSLSEQAAMGESYKKALDSTGEDFKFKRDRWKSELNALKRERDAAYRVQKENLFNLFNSYRADPDFLKYAAEGAAIENPEWMKAKGGGTPSIFGWSPLGEDVNNKVTFYLENKKAGGEEAYEFMTQQEKDLYNYMLAKKGDEEADGYLKFLHPVLSERKMQKMTSDAVKDAEKSPVLASLGSAALSLMDGAGWLDSKLKEAAGLEIDPNDMRYAPSRMKSALRGTVSNKIKESSGPLGDVTSFLYEHGMSLADMLLAYAVTGSSKFGKPAMLSFMGTSAATGATLDAFDRGATQEQALNAGLWAGIAEIVFEKLSLDHFIKLSSPSAKKALIKNTLKQAGIEASEEAMTEIANAFTDSAIMGDLSNYNLALKGYLEQGLSKDDAEREARLDIAKNVGLSALGGALSGGTLGILGGVAGKAGTAKAGKRVAQQGQVNTLIERALTLPGESRAYQIAQELSQNNERPSNTDIGRLYVAYAEDGGDVSFLGVMPDANQNATEGQPKPTQTVETDIRQAAYETGSQGINQQEAQQQTIPISQHTNTQLVEAQNAPRTPQSAHTLINTGDVANVPQRAAATAAKAVFNGSGADAEVTGVAAVEDGRVYVSLSDGGTALAGDVSFDDPGLDRLYASASVFDTPGARAFVSGYDGSVDVGAYYSGFASIYGAARKGMTQRQAVNGSLYAQSLPPEARQIAYFAGQNAGKLANAKTPASATANTAPQAAQTIRRPAPDAAGDRAQEAAPAQRGKGGVERDFSRKLTAGQEQSVKAIDAIARAIGRKVHIVESIGMGSDGKPVTNARGSVDRGEVNAYFDEATNEYYISLNGVGEAYMYFALHESIHDIRRNNELGYENLEQIVFDVLKERGEDADALLEAQKELYPGAGKKYWREEVVANTVPAILTERRTLDMFIERIIKSGEDTRSVFEKLIDSIRSLLQKAYNALKGEKSWRQMELIKGDMDALERIREAYFAALEDLEGTGEAGAGGGGRFSINPSFEREYDAWNGKDPKGFFVVGSTSKALQSIGINPRNIEWDKSKIIKIKEKHPGMTDSVIKQVPNILEKPIVIMQSKQADSRVVLFGEVFDANHVPVLAVLELQPKIKQKFGLDVLKIASAYGKDTNPQKLINESKILYVEPDKNRTNRWLEGTRLRLPFDLKNYGSIDKIAYSDASVNNSMSKNSGDIRFSLKDVDGKKVAVAEKDILKGVPKSEVNKTIAAYIKKHIGEYYTIAQSGSRVYIGKDLSGEYLYSKSTNSLMRAEKAAKYKATSSLGEMIEIASNRRWERARHAEKHRIDAKYGFYKYSTSFAIPEMNGADGIDHYNGYEADLVIRNDADGKKYLYDVISIKKSPAPWVAALNSKLSQKGAIKSAHAEPSNINIAHSDASVNPSIHQDERNNPSVPVKQMITSAQTSIKQVPALFKNANVHFGAVNIDIGGGKFDLATKYLADKGTNNIVFDPYNRNANENAETLSYLQDGKRADTVTCANVLNVIAEPDARANVILEAAKALKPDGKAYFMVYEGDGRVFQRKRRRAIRTTAKHPHMCQRLNNISVMWSARVN